MIAVGERLIAAQHYASSQIQNMSSKLEGKWAVLRSVVEERVELLDLSVSFHDSEEKVRMILYK